MARPKKIQEEAPSDWQTVFCSLAIILVAFFVMLCSYATLEQGKIVQVSRSFRGAMKLFSGGILFDKGEGVVLPSPDVTFEKINRVAVPIYQMLKGQGLEQSVTLKSSEEFVTLTLLTSLVFQQGSAIITNEARPVLSNIAGILQQLPLPVRIEGHTDDTVEYGTRYRSNWELSALRAVSVMKYFHDAESISYDRMTATGFAQYRPFVPNRTDEERRRNRRVEIIIPLAEDYFSSRQSIIRDAPPSFKVWDLAQ